MLGGALADHVKGSCIILGLSPRNSMFLKEFQKHLFRDVDEIERLLKLANLLQ